MRRKQIQNITITALFAGISIILYFYVKFPLPFFPPFLEINFSMLPAILIGYIAGPFYGSIVVIIRFLVKLGITHTAGVGEIADLLIGISTVLVTSLIYYFKKSKKGAILSLFIGAIVWIATATIFNWLLLVPTYVKLYFNNDLDKFISVLSMIPSVNEKNYMQKYLLFAVVPFNALLSSIVCIVTFFVYKPLSRLIKEDNQDKKRTPKIQSSIKNDKDNNIEIDVKIKKD